jgi:hypothetical protein
MLESLHSAVCFVGECESMLGIPNEGEQPLDERLDSIVYHLKNVQSKIQDPLLKEKGIDTTLAELADSQIENPLSDQVDEYYKVNTEGTAARSIAAVLSGLLGKTWNGLSAIEQKKITDEMQRFDVSFDPDKV